MLRASEAYRERLLGPGPNVCIGRRQPKDFRNKVKPADYLAGIEKEFDGSALLDSPHPLGDNLIRWAAHYW